MIYFAPSLCYLLKCPRQNIVMIVNCKWSSQLIFTCKWSLNVHCLYPLKILCLEEILRNSAPVSNTSSYPHYIMFQTMQTICLLSGCDPCNKSVLYFVIVILATWQCQHILCIHYWVELSLMLSSLLYIMLCQCYIFLYFPIFSYIFLYFLGWHPPAINSYIRTTSLACGAPSRCWQEPKLCRQEAVLLSI